MLPTRSFYLIRHGQSMANIEHITAGGQSDSPLSPLGHEQGKTLAPFLSQLEIKPSHMYHSTMIRARDTAMYLNETLKLGATPVRDLREHEMGAWDGIPWKEVLPHVVAGETPPGGENTSMFAQRIQSTLTDIMDRHPEGDPPIIVAHGGLFHAIGFLYEYGMSEVQNCHLHYFEPEALFDTFPWRVWMFDVEDGRLVKKPAPFCISHALEKMAG